MIIKNVKKYTENGNFEDAEIYIEGERFAGSVTEDASEPVIDGEGAYALPVSSICISTDALVQTSVTDPGKPWKKSVHMRLR